MTNPDCPDERELCSMCCLPLEECDCELVVETCPECGCDPCECDDGS